MCPGHELTPLECLPVAPAQLPDVTQSAHLAHKASRPDQMECEMQEQILGTEHQRVHRLDLDRARPLPEVLDRDASSGWPPIYGTMRTEDVIADVEQHQSLRV